jgi:hypothetical protein
LMEAGTGDPEDPRDLGKLLNLLCLARACPPLRSRRVLL